MATRRDEAERACTDSDGSACPLEVALTRADGRAVVQGTARPFPHVTWDITIVVERLTANAVRAWVSGGDNNAAADRRRTVAGRRDGEIADDGSLDPGGCWATSRMRMAR